MRKLDINSLIQLFTTLSVVIGIVLVIFELRQTRDIAATDLRSQSLLLGMELKSSLIGDRGVEALSNACLSEELDIRDIVVLDTYFRAIYDQINYLRLISSTFGSDWEIYAEGQFERVILSTSHGREWWNGFNKWADPEIRNLGNQTLSRLNEPSCKDDLVRQYRALSA